MKLPLILAAGAALVMLAGCETGPYGPGPGYYGPVGDIEYDGWYDGFYGPVYDGYWRGGHFWYRDAEGHPFRRDTANHFAHEAHGPSFQHIHGTAHIGGGGGAHRPG